MFSFVWTSIIPMRVALAARVLRPVRVAWWSQAASSGSSFEKAHPINSIGDQIALSLFERPRSYHIISYHIISYAPSILPRVYSWVSPLFSVVLVAVVSSLLKSLSILSLSICHGRRFPRGFSIAAVTSGWRCLRKWCQSPRSRSSTAAGAKGSR